MRPRRSYARLVSLQPEPSPIPLHRRTIEFDAYEVGEFVRVIGQLKDLRPWAADAGRSVVHHMELEVDVRRSDLVIVAAKATMHAFPHVECTDIERAFSGLVGLSVGRGYTKAVSERFIGVLGCSHIEHLARALGPAVVQAVATTYAKDHAGGTTPQGSRGSMGTPWLRNTCHIWAEGGIGEQKVALGGFPAHDREYPVPAIEVLIRRKAARAAPAES